MLKALNAGSINTMSVFLHQLAHSSLSYPLKQLFEELEAVRLNQAAGRLRESREQAEEYKKEREVKITEGIPQIKRVKTTGCKFAAYLPSIRTDSLR